jgi:hypothetical protein
VIDSVEELFQVKVNDPPIALRHTETRQRISGIASQGKLAPGSTAYGASRLFATVLHFGLPPDLASGDALVFSAGFPPSGSPEDLHLLSCAHAGRTLRRLVGL